MLKQLANQIALKLGKVSEIEAETRVELSEGVAFTDSFEDGALMLCEDKSAVIADGKHTTKDGVEFTTVNGEVTLTKVEPETDFITKTEFLELISQITEAFEIELNAVKTELGQMEKPLAKPTVRTTEPRKAVSKQDLAKMSQKERSAHLMTKYGN